MTSLRFVPELTFVLLYCPCSGCQSHEQYFHVAVFIYRPTYLPTKAVPYNT